MHNPKFTILIPTRNGEKYVFSAIKSILSQSYPFVEVIVSVNHSNDETLLKLNQILDKRLKVIVPPTSLSMAKHYEWCIKHANGEWVTILGDDDAVMPYFFDEIEMLLSEYSNIEAISFKRAYYIWPGCEKLYGKLAIKFTARKKNYLINGKKIILENLIGLKDHFDLPQLYTNNIIKRSLIEKILVTSGGNFYYELTPDVYSGVVIALNAHQILRSEFPVFWTGTSPKSVGFSLSITSNKKEYSALQKTRGEEHLNMSKHDGLAIADEVGKEFWETYQASSIYVISALIRYPAILPSFISKRLKLLILLAKTEAIWRDLWKKMLFRGLYRNLSLIKKYMQNHMFIFIIFSILINISFMAYFFKKIISICAIRTKLIKAKTFRSYSHIDFQTIEDAEKIVRMILRG